MNEPYSITARELSDAGKEKFPDELITSTHLIYSSPATLAFNSPGAQGFGVKRAGLAIPGSVMTSGNISGAPICRTDEDALSELSSMCDLILSHNRRIRLRADDSVMPFSR